MGGLFSALNSSAAALGVFSRALDVEQQNVANSATPGYASQRVRISDAATGSTGGTADTISISSASDTYADALVRQNSADAGKSNSQVQVLSGVNQLFDITGKSGVLAAFQKFSSAFSQLSVTPGDTALRGNAITAGQQVATAFRDLAGSLDKQRSQVDSQINGTVQQINSFASQIATINSNSRAGQPNDAALRQSLDGLSNLVDINVTKNSDGTVSVLAGGQIPLVAEDRSYAISATGLSGSAAGGLAQVAIQSTNGQSTAAFTGQLGGLLAVRNTTLPGLLGGGGQPGAINQLATTFANQANSILTSAQTSSGTSAVAGSPLFSVNVADSTDAARSFQALSITPDQLGVATTGPNASSNGAALALAGLSSSNDSSVQISGLSLESFFAQAASTVGQQLTTQTSEQTQHQTALSSAQSSRQQEIGVSLDREAIAISAYQRAYQASAQVVSTLNRLTQVEVDLIK